MNTLSKKCTIFLFSLSVIIQSNGQIFSLVDSIPTKISKIKYSFLPIQSDNDFNFLRFSFEKEKQNFELFTIKGTATSKMKIKNAGLDGGGFWYESAAMSNKMLLLYHVNGYLVIYEKNKKENYVLTRVINVGQLYSVVSLLDNENILLINDYNGYTEKKLYANYALDVLDLQKKEITYSKEMDLGKGILLSHFNEVALIESKKNKIAVAHPTLPFIYIYNEKLEPIDTIHAQFQQTISVDSVINAVFTDSFITLNRTNPKEIIETIDEKKINKMERIEKVFWLNDDILGYTICQPYSQRAKIFVFYSISEKKELYKRIELYPEGSKNAYNFVYSKRILINNNKTIDIDYIYKDDESDIYYKFNIYEFLPFNGTK